jgi:hypothetical protein
VSAVKVVNWTTEAKLAQMRSRGWIERSREHRPCEQRVVVELFHPQQSTGAEEDRYVGPVVTFRSLPADAGLSTPDLQLPLFQGGRPDRLEHS